MDIEFGRKLKEARKKAGLTQSKLASYLGLAGKQAISNWEHGLSYPNTETLAALARYLNISIDYLLGNSAGLLKGLDDPELIEMLVQEPTLPVGEWRTPSDEFDESAGDINEHNARDMHIPLILEPEFEAFVAFMRSRNKNID